MRHPAPRDPVRGNAVDVSVGAFRKPSGLPVFAATRSDGDPTASGPPRNAHEGRTRPPARFDFKTPA
jgi:hypothetical protein